MTHASGSGKTTESTDPVEVKPIRGLAGSVRLPGDKSISHRALILGALANGTMQIRNCSPGEDVGSTARCLAALGVPIREEGDALCLEGSGHSALSEPQDVLDAGNSGTTIRLLAGVLSGQPFFSVLTGDASLRRRPMNRVVGPLQEMGAEIWARGGGRFAPLAVRGRPLKPIHYNSPVASAQVKTAILLAGLALPGETSFSEPFPSRDHTERMLRHLGADIDFAGERIRLRGGNRLLATDLSVPGDPSSAAFLAVAALITRESDLWIRGVCVNPTRIGYLRILERMGAHVEWGRERDVCGEPVADLRVRSSRLMATTIRPEEIPAAIDEIPVLCIAAAFADGVTRISGAAELRVKESDRIAAMASNLAAMGVRVEESPDGLTIEGRQRLHAFVGSSWGDHRIALSLIVAALAAEAPSRVAGASSMTISFPGFLDLISPLIRPT